MWADSTALPGEASAFPRPLGILSCTSLTGRECQCHQVVRRLIELCTQVDWNFFSQQFGMLEPGTGRTSIIPEIWGCVNHNQHSAEIRISLKGFLPSAVSNQSGVGFAHTRRRKPQTPVRMLPRAGVPNANPLPGTRAPAPSTPAHHSLRLGQELTHRRRVLRQGAGDGHGQKDES